MAILWKPNGTLNVATDPSDLPEEKGTALTETVGSVASEALARCKNLRLDQAGVIKTRDGSTKLNSTAISTPIYKIIEQGGTRYSFGSTIIYEDETSIETGQTAAAWSGMLYNAYNDTEEDIFATNGTDRVRIEDGSVYEWGIAAPAVAPTTAVGALTGLTGDYSAKYTYCRKVGATVVCESNPSPVGTTRTLADESLSVTWTASSDSQVTHVRIYRTLTGGSAWYWDQDVAIGTVTVDTDTADGSLGSEVATDHDRPPLNGSFVLGPNYLGTCFIAAGNLLYYCKPKQPEYWPATYFVEISPIQFPIQCVVLYNGAPYILTKHAIYNLQGTGHETFFPFSMDAITGAQGPLGAISVHGHGIFHVGTDGIYLFSGSSDTNLTQAAFGPIFRGETAGGLPAVTTPANSWMAHLGNKLYFGYVSSGYTYPTNVLCMNLDTGRTSYYEYPFEIQTVTTDTYNNRLLAADTDGYVWVIEDSAATTDEDDAIEWEAQSKDFMLQTRAHFPRWCKYDVDASDADEANGYVILEDAVHQTHALSTRTGKKRLVATGNGQRMAIRVSGSGTVEIYAVEAE